MVERTTPELELPGGELVAKGIEDLRAGRETEASLLVAIAADRLRAAGLDVPRSVPRRPSHRLYALLARTAGDDAHGRYNALLTRLSSFARALEGRGRSSP